MKIIPIAVLAAALIMTTAVADTRQEIAHLLSFIEKTSCKYERNGSMHDGREARDHINRKYQHYREKVKTSEDFIKYSATKSMISGKKYKIHCPGTGTVDTSDWLLTELQHYRRQQEH